MNKNFQLIKKIVHRIERSGEAAAFKDEASIASYAKEAVEAMLRAGLINGVGNDEFAPKKYASRAEVATIIYKLLGLM